MKYKEFVGQVQHRARLGTQGETVRAIHATLETLGERIVADEAAQLAAQLPQEIGHYLQLADTSDRFPLDEFLQRVAKREKVDLPDATHHARSVISVLQEAVTGNQIEHVLAQLPNEYRPLFTAGSEGEMRTA